jgi:hypothetical protein
MSDRENRAFASRLRKLSLVITEAMLTSAVNNTPQDIALGTLPAGAVVTGRSVKLGAYFTGGGATTCTMSIGTAAAQTDIMTALNVLDTTVLNKPLQGTAGAAPLGSYGGAAIVARFTPDATHNLAGLTAGSVEVEVYYSVPDAAVDRG